MEAHYIREADGEGWLRISRDEIEAMNIEITSESRQDDTYIYLNGCDVQSFYAEMMRGGRLFQGTSPHVIKLDGEEPTIEVIAGMSNVRNLEPVS